MMNKHALGYVLDCGEKTSDYRSDLLADLRCPKRGLQYFISPFPQEEKEMDDVMTIEEIEAQFESEWILIEDPETNEALEVQSGKVRWHSQDRDEVYRKAVELRPKRFAMLFTGKMPEDTAIVL
jgi:hypothetical protein